MRSISGSLMPVASGVRRFYAATLRQSPSGCRRTWRHSWRHDVFMRYLVRDCDHIGKMFAMFGIKLARQRSVA